MGAAPHRVCAARPAVERAPSRDQAETEARAAALRLRSNRSKLFTCGDSATQLTFTWMDRGFASAFLGSETVRTPFFDSARTFSASTVPGRVNDRVNVP